jgi:hypothetical protein
MPWAVAVVRVALVLILAGELYVTAVIQAPGLVHPSTIGSDTSNYYAAGLRLNEGHNLYGPLLPGDRPVPGYPDRYPAPLLSPPLVAVIWRPLALLGDASMEIWWAANLAFVVGLLIWFAAVGRRWTLAGALAVLALGLPIALVLSAPYRQPGFYSPVSTAALSGNLNGYVTGLCALVWWAAVRGRARLAGITAALAAVLKLGPFVLVWWFVVRRDWPAMKTFIATVGVLGIVGLLGAGLDANLAFMGIALGGHITPTALSVPWLLEAAFHLHPRLADLGTIVATVVGLAVIYATRRRARLSFLVAIMVVIWSSPVVLVGNLVILLAAAAPGEAPAPLGPIDPDHERQLEAVG